MQCNIWTKTHTAIFTVSPTYIHAYLLTCIHTCMHICKGIETHGYSQKYRDACIYAYTCNYTLTRMPTPGRHWQVFFHKWGRSFGDEACSRGAPSGAQVSAVWGAVQGCGADSVLFGTVLWPMWAQGGPLGRKEKPSLVLEVRNRCMFWSSLFIVTVHCTWLHKCINLCVNMYAYIHIYEHIKARITYAPDSQSCTCSHHCVS